MKIIEKNNSKILVADEGKLLKDININTEVLEDGTIIEPYKTKEIYLGIQIDTLEKAKELYEEVDE